MPINNLQAPLPGGEPAKITDLVKEYKGPEAEKKGRIRSAMTRALSFIAQPVTAKLAQKYEAMKAKQEKASRTNPHDANKLKNTMDRLEKLPGVKKTLQANAIKKEIAAKRNAITEFKNQFKDVSNTFKWEFLDQKLGNERVQLEQRTKSLESKREQLNDKKMELGLREDLANVNHEVNRAEFNRLKDEKDRINEEFSKLPSTPTAESQKDFDRLMEEEKNLNEAVEALKINGRASKAELEEVKRLKNELNENVGALDNEELELTLDNEEYKTKTTPLYKQSEGLMENLSGAEKEAESLLKELEGTPLYQDALSWYTDIIQAKVELQKTITEMKGIENVSIKN